jgi:hypothetical protein
MFNWIRQGELVVPPIPGWHNFFARGAGTSARRNSTGGFYHHLQNIAESGFKDIHSLDLEAKAANAVGYYGRPDLLLRTSTGELIQREFKNLVPGQPFTGKAQLTAIIDAAKRRATPAGSQIPDPDQLARELSRLEYVFRGAEIQHPGVRGQFMAQLRTSLGPKFADLADSVKVTFQVTGVPF